jgi:hypothetical protein
MRRGLNDAKHWRDRAAEMRVLAAEMQNTRTAMLMNDLAHDYDKLADRAEERAKTDEQAASPLREHIPAHPSRKT